MLEKSKILSLWSHFMSKFKVAINGMGRIGRTIIRELYSLPERNFDIVAVNNPGPQMGHYLHLLEYDSVHGPFKGNLEYQNDGDRFSINGEEIRFFSVREPENIPWEDLNVDIVIDATGKFKDGASLSKHMKGSVKKVIMCAPGKDLDGTFVMGINHEQYDPSSHHVISNASCTTNCLAPVAKVLNDEFGIASGFMTTVHAYTSDQQLLDGSHKDLRRARSAAMSIVPTSTGAAKAVGLVIPELKGKLDGLAMRVPTPNVSVVDLNVILNKKTSVEEINAAFEKAASGSLKGILKNEKKPLVSIDYCGMRESSCVDLELTNYIDGMAKVVAWYDNEAGFSNRIIDLTNYVGEKL
jgi:glyceraldehyde-3-phosphate dehydrogenase type I